MSDLNFSQRMGLKPSQKLLQINSIDQDLKTGLWNIFDIEILCKLGASNAGYTQNYPRLTLLCKKIWQDFFKERVDSVPEYISQVRGYLRSYWFDKAKWNEIYEMMEFCCDLVGNNNEFSSSISTNQLQNSFNIILEREFAAYRFIAGEISPITNKNEIKELTDSIYITAQMTSLKGANVHLEAALKKLSDKTSPDYRNSIKESISAVESVAKAISGNSNDTLGAALDKIRGKINIHSALERGFKQIYGYTSDSSGIRHAISNDATCDFEDAKFMLISCSAFINYLIVKAQKAGITL